MPQHQLSLLPTSNIQLSGSWEQGLVPLVAVYVNVRLSTTQTRYTHCIDQGIGIEEIR